ncbi:MAG TPA: hypothetical protein VKG82_10375 [Solirubrobacteraceae bacterium]|nr:hypothetical protein [Solirubrobacteraceae bacterium]
MPKLSRVSPPASDRPEPPGSAGLCETCVHQQVVRNTRGSRFSLCLRSRSDPAYPRYPRLPVTRCEGHERPHPSLGRARQR